MKKNRRSFLKTVAHSGMMAAATTIVPPPIFNTMFESNNTLLKEDDSAVSLSGQYGIYFSNNVQKSLPMYSFRNTKYTSIDNWRKTARKVVLDRIAAPALGAMPTIKIIDQYDYNGVSIEELEWSLPYGRPTKATLLKPAGHTGKLPGIIALHDHGGNKYFGRKKLTDTGKENAMVKEIQAQLYEGKAYANDLAKKGYVVLVPDAFAFGSRRVMLADVPSSINKDLLDPEENDFKGIQAYNTWAGNHEHILSKSLLSAGTTWPGVFFAEDQMALNILAARKDVNAQSIGCIGLSGGGLRTVLLSGLDARIKCAIPVGFMTTWQDLALNKCHTHTWMTYIPLLPKELDFPEILTLRAPLPSLVMNDNEDALFTLSYMKQADDIIKQVYTKCKAADKYKTSFYPGPHKFDRAMQEEAFTWFDKWLL